MIVDTIRNMSAFQFSYLWQQVNGSRHEIDNYWIKKQKAVVNFLENVQAHQDRIADLYERRK
jgi:hypothetical protein